MFPRIGDTSIANRQVRRCRDQAVPERCELAVAVTNNVRWFVLPLLLEKNAPVSGLLRHPQAVRVGRHARDMHPPRRNVNEEEHVVLHQPPKRPHFLREEIAGPKGVQVPADEFIPGAFPTFGTGVEAVLLQHPGSNSRRCTRPAKTGGVADAVS